MANLKKRIEGLEKKNGGHVSDADAPYNLAALLCAMKLDYPEVLEGESYQEYLRRLPLESLKALKERKESESGLPTVTWRHHARVRKALFRK